VTALLTLLLAAACANAGAPVHTLRRDSAGIHILEQLSAAPDTFITNTAVIELGRLGRTGRSSDTFQSSDDFCVLRDGRIVVVAQRDVRVALFSTDGRWLGDIGRLGTGAGEFVAPGRVSVLGDSLFVSDATLGRLLVFTTAGQFVRSFPLAQRVAGFGVEAVPGGFVVAVESGHLEDPVPAIGLLLRHGPDGVVSDTIAGPYPVHDLAWRTDTIRHIDYAETPPVFSAAPIWNTRHHEALLVRPGASVIDVLDTRSGQILLKLLTLKHAATVTAEDRAAWADAVTAGYPPNIRISLHVEGRFASQRPGITAALLDDRGRIWLSGFNAATPGHIAQTWDVFDRAGTLRHIRFPMALRLVQIHDDMAWALVEKRIDMRRGFVVQAYRING